MTYILTPAYGRDYTSKAKVIEAFESGVDFCHASAPYTGNGSYISKAEIPAGSVVNLRYKRLTAAAVVKL